ncbi:MAG: radical SAM protein [Candidatus Omnitrophota bacterium]
MNEKVILIYPQTGFELRHVNIFLPMGLMCIAAPLVKRGVEVTILDQRIEKNFFKNLKKHLDESPVCVGISTMTGTQILYALEIARFIRNNSKVPIVWGGVHPTLTAEQTIYNDNVDVVVRGEGEITFDELVNTLYRGKSLSGIKGITWKQGKTVQHNPDREYCDLNTLPRVPYHLVDVEQYIVPQVPGRKRCLNIYSSRGCPNLCTFCYNTKFNRSRYRLKNIDAVIDEIKWLVKQYNLDSFCMNDDNFSIDPERTHYFCRRLIEEKIVPEWGCKGMEIWRLEKIDLELMQKSGCKRVYMGIESGSEKVLKSIKRRDTVQGIKNMVNKFANSNIIAHYNFVIGFPDEGVNELNETIEMADYIRKTDPKAYFSSFHICTPFPGTELFNNAVENYGFIPPDKLEGWYDFRLEAINVPWINKKMKNTYLNLCLITYFIDDKFADRTKDKPVLKIFKKIMMWFSHYRWKTRKFKFCPEYRLLDWLMNYKIRKKTKGIRKLAATMQSN